ncbi:RDD family protein [Shewanella sp. JM162201]|uniref:RDD family protein n=1 Tax=Shewanella jiangmenensis TaxID=2837387 RepID=A0ABS5V5K7_9GAMM|nr:RDD family protein [Shewanella jiangmenensis]MBT1445752.1 RDD family protein [Shewanella jiangmenensis]
MDKPDAQTAEMAVNTRDPRTIITPHAFSVARELLYTPLATPWKRALAMLIDATLIAVLTEEAGVVFVALVLLTSYLGKRTGGLGRFAKYGMYLLMSLVLLYAIAEHFRPQPESDAAKITDAVKFVPQTVSLSLCDDAACAKTQALGLANTLAQSNLSREEAELLLFEPLEALAITDAERQAIDIEARAIIQHLPLKKAAEAPEPESLPASEPVSLPAPEKAPELSAKTDAAHTSPSVIGADLTAGDEVADSVSPLAWIKGLLNDLGLGFGWAAFYFTVFTAWFDGQTLGKKLLGIRVICLDGSKLKLWGAFGRYGGYGAGFATGLLGFLQIFWDANRQAIQDKISSTVVIDLHKPKAVPESVCSGSTAPAREETKQ